MKKQWLGQLLTGFLLSFSTLVSAEQPEQSFPVKVAVANSPLKLCSQAELKAFRLIHVGRAALYLQDCNKIPDIFSFSQKQLRFLYDTPIPAKAFREASYEYLKINLGQKFNQWKASFDQFNNNYQDIKVGDYYDLVYDPLTGLLLQLNGKDLATLQDPNIALAYLNVWFGHKPFSADLKNTLLKLSD